MKTLRPFGYAMCGTAYAHEGIILGCGLGSGSGGVSPVGISRDSHGSGYGAGTGYYKHGKLSNGNCPGSPMSRSGVGIGNGAWMYGIKQCE